MKLSLIHECRVTENLYETEVVSEMFGFGKEPELGPIGKNIVDLAQKLGWKNNQINKLKQRIAGLDENTSFGRDALQQMLLGMQRGSFTALSQAIKRNR